MATRSDSRQSARFGRILKTLLGSTRGHWRGLIALASGFIVAVGSAWTLATGSEVKLFDLAVTNLSIAVAMWFILTAAVLFTSLMATSCYLFIRPGELKVCRSHAVQRISARAF